MPETNLMTVHEPPPMEQVSDDDIRRFAGYINDGVNSWVKAGQLLVQMREIDPGIFERITEKFPGISWDILQAFDNIGRKRIYPFLMLDNCVGSRKLLAMPYDEQVRLYQAKIDVVTGINEGAAVVEKKRIQQLTAAEVERVFFGNRVKSIPEQAADYQTFTSKSKNKTRTINKSAYVDELHSRAVPALVPPRDLQTYSRDSAKELTPTQLKVLELIATGLINKEIADQLGSSIKTIEKHAQEVFDKLNIHDRVMLTHYALAFGFTQNIFTKPPPSL